MKMMNISNHRKQNAIPLKGLTVALPAAGIAMVMASCMSLRGSSSGGEVTGVGGSSMAEPTPYGMVLIDRGAYAMGPSKNDSAAGIRADAKPVSVDAFWMDETEITNSKYKQFVSGTPSSASASPTRPTAATRPSRSRKTRRGTP